MFPRARVEPLARDEEDRDAFFAAVERLNAFENAIVAAALPVDDDLRARYERRSRRARLGARELMEELAAELAEGVDVELRPSGPLTSRAAVRTALPRVGCHTHAYRPRCALSRSRGRLFDAHREIWIRAQTQARRQLTPRSADQASDRRGGEALLLLRPAAH